MPPPISAYAPKTTMLQRAAADSSSLSFVLGRGSLMFNASRRFVLHEFVIPLSYLPTVSGSCSPQQVRNHVLFKRGGPQSRRFYGKRIIAQADVVEAGRGSQRDVSVGTGGN
jgi:hypothetical protein